MNTPAQRGNSGENRARPMTSWLHARVYALLIGFVVWFVLSVWSFVGAGVTDYLLFIVSGFILFAVALTLVLSRVGQEYDAPDAAPDAAVDGDARPPSFRAWAATDFETWQGRLSGSQAAILVLLPIAAAALGMTAFGIAYHIAERGM